jgi:hypothetical protein
MQSPETHVAHAPRPIRLDQFRAGSAAVTPYHHRVIAHLVRRIVTSWTPRSTIRELHFTGHANAPSLDYYGRALWLRCARAVHRELFAVTERVKPELTSRIQCRIRSKYDAVLVARTLGPKANGGKLVEEDGLSWYLDQVLTSLKAYGPYANTATLRLRNLIVACHSGGGHPILQIALSKQRYSDNFEEFWGSYCLYNTCDDTSWDARARLNPSRRLFIDYLSKVSVSAPESNHYCVPIHNWVKRLSTAKSVLAKP